MPTVHLFGPDESEIHGWFPPLRTMGATSDMPAPRLRLLNAAAPTRFAALWGRRVHAAGPSLAPPFTASSALTSKMPAFLC